MKTHLNLDKTVKGLPSFWYYDRNIFEQELKQIWENNWLFVGSEGNLPEPLTYITHKIGRQNIIILRDQNGNIKAYHNSCRHRGSALCLEDSGTLPGKTLLCPYHNWSYDASNGKLRKVPSSTPDDFDTSQYGLFAVQVKTWRGLIFITLNPEEVTWETPSVFQSYDPLLDKFPLELLKLGHRWQKKVACNWKLYWENYSECLHCPNVHPELSELVPVYSRRLNTIRDQPGWEKNASRRHPKFRGGLRENAETWSADGSTQGKNIAGVDFPDGQSYSTTWPTMFLGAYRDHVRTVRIMPLDSENTELTAEFLFPSETLADKNYNPDNVTEFAKLVMLQDAEAAEWNQRGVMCPRLQAGVVMPEEYTVKQFHDWLNAQLPSLAWSPEI